MTPTPVVVPLLWGAAGLGGLLLLNAGVAQPQATLQKLFLALLLSLGAMIAWRSNNAPNALAAQICLLAVALAAQLSAKEMPAKFAALVAWGWLLAGLVNAAFGLMQYLGGTMEPIGTAVGFLRQRNQLATLGNIALLALLYLWHHKQISAQWAMGASLPLVAALAATMSRAGLLELVVVSTILATQRTLWRGLAWTLLAYALFAFVLPVLAHTSENIWLRIEGMAQGASAQSFSLQDARRALWDNTLAVTLQHPWLGVGWRELAPALRLSDFGDAPRFPDQADNAHNLPLHFAAELGIPFALLWCAALAWLVVRNKPWQVKSAEQLLGWGVLLVIGLHSLLEYPLWFAPFQIATGFAAGLVFVQSSSQPNRALGFAWQGFVGALLLVFAVYAAFDYHRVRQLFIADSERSLLYQGRMTEHAQRSWLFAAQVRYAKLNTTPITESNAAAMWRLGQEVLHFSPEPYVLESLIASGKYLAPTDAAIAAQVAFYEQQLATIFGKAPRP